MSKPSDVVETIATRRAHWLTLVLEIGGTLVRFVGPALLVPLLQLRGTDRGERFARTIALVALGLVVPVTIFRVLAFRAFRFGTSADALVVRSGVLNRQRRVIPFERIQSVQVTQSAIERLLGMARLKVETATTGANAEASIGLLKRADADTLRGDLLRLRDVARGGERGVASARPSDRAADRGSAAASGAFSAVGAGDAAAPTPTPAIAHTIATLDVEALMVAGGTSGNFGILVALLASACERFGDGIVDRLALPGAVDPGAWIAAGLANVWLGLALLAFVGLPLLFVIWCFAVAGAVVRYHGFALEQVGRDLRRRYGLFARVESSVPLARAQAVRLRETALRRALGYGELQLVSAGAPTGGENGASGGLQPLLPIVRVREAAPVVRAVFPALDSDGLLEAPTTAGAWTRVSPRTVVRALARRAPWVSALAAALLWWRASAWPVALAVLVFVLATAWLPARVRGFAQRDGFLLVRNGGLRRTTVILPEAKLQRLDVERGPLQRWLGLASVRLQSAGGGGEAAVIDLPVAAADALVAALASRLPRTVVVPSDPARAPMRASRRPAAVFSSAPPPVSA